VYLVRSPIQLWDVCSDQEAVDLVRDIEDPVTGAKLLVDHALDHFSTDNLSCMIIRLDREGHLGARGGDKAEVAETPAAAAEKGGPVEGSGGFKPTVLGSTAEEATKPGGGGAAKVKEGNPAAEADSTSGRTE
jgi:protein phosphatase PTC1